jgi:hypothetical protein
MLEDPAFQPVVSWGPHGDCFVVKDMNEFTKSILPRMFKHSNFASFVRQLNKYDFHKVSIAFPFFPPSFSSHFLLSISFLLLVLCVSRAPFLRFPHK